MISAAAVLVCALEVLGRAPASLPPIELVDVAPLGASRHVEAFVQPDSGVISLLTTSAVFATARQSRCGARDAVRKLASIIVHEEWHVRHGPNERGAYEAQLMALLRLGAPHDGPLYSGVMRAMNVALRSRARAERVVAMNTIHRR